MTRVPIDLVLLALHDHGINATAGAVRNWVYRGKITYADGYDLAEISAYVGREIAPRDRCPTTGRIQSRAPRLTAGHTTCDTFSTAEL